MGALRCLNKDYEKGYTLESSKRILCQTELTNGKPPHEKKSKDDALYSQVLDPAEGTT